MQTYISILRGINVSGHKMIKMPELATLFESLDFKDVKTYIQSGNVVFQSTITNQADLENKIKERIAEKFGFEVPVMVKSTIEWGDVVNHNPFVNNRHEDETKLHVTFLSAEPESILLDKIKSGLYNHDEYVIDGKTVYLFCPDGYGNTKLSNTFFESKLKVTATTRNWKTVNELMNMANKIS